MAKSKTSKRYTRGFRQELVALHRAGRSIPDLKYLGEEATEEHAKALGKGMRYVHFATHALLDERFPLNSSLVLTIPSNRPKDKRTDYCGLGRSSNRCAWMRIWSLSSRAVPG